MMGNRSVVVLGWLGSPGGSKGAHSSPTSMGTTGDGACGSGVGVCGGVGTCGRDTTICGVSGWGHT
jgi:hypothetical protein